MNKTCRARQQSDQMCCNRCGLLWDVNDPEPPRCRDDEDLSKDKGRDVLRMLREMLDNKKY